MTKLSWFGVLLSLLLFAAPAAAQDTAPAEAEWQAVITGQIQAFRDKDAPAALSFAGAEFKKNFTDPAQFFIAIMGSGYTPIMDSRSHTFGQFKLVTPEQVVQDVKFIGNDQSLYEAIYQLDKEADGWRVHGVQLMKQPGVGV